MRARWLLHPLVAAGALAVAGVGLVAAGGHAWTALVAGAAAGFANSGST
jgi:hypothetical protein